MCNKIYKKYLGWHVSSGLGVYDVHVGVLYRIIKSLIMYFIVTVGNVWKTRLE